MGNPHHEEVSMTQQRQWVEIGRKTMECVQHGSFEAVTEELLPRPRHPLTRQEKSFTATSSCPICNAEKQREADIRESEIRGGMTERDRLRAQAIREAGIPARFKNCTVWNWQHGIDQQRRVWDIVRDYCTGFEQVIESGRCIVFFGAPGTGKTHLLCGIVRHIVEKGGTALYTTALDAVGRIRATYDKDNRSESEEQAMGALATCDLLAIDEVGRQTDSAHEREMLFRILDKRYAGCKPTALSSNLGRDALLKFLGSALVDRMAEAGGRTLCFDWASQRNKTVVAKQEGDA